MFAACCLSLLGGLLHRFACSRCVVLLPSLLKGFLRGLSWLNPKEKVNNFFRFVSGVSGVFFLNSEKGSTNRKPSSILLKTDLLSDTTSPKGPSVCLLTGTLLICGHVPASFSAALLLPRWILKRLFAEAFAWEMGWFDWAKHKESFGVDGYHLPTLL